MTDAFQEQPAETHASVDDENPFRAPDVPPEAVEGFAFRPTALAIGTLTIALFLAGLANPWNSSEIWSDLAFIYVQLAIAALANAILLYAAFRSARAIVAGSRFVAPGEWLVVGMGGQAALHVLADIFYAVWLRTGHDVTSLGLFEMAWNYSGCVFVAALLLFASLRREFEPPWGRTLCFGGALYGLFGLVGPLAAVLWGLEMTGVRSDAQIVASALLMIGTALVALPALAWIAFVCGLLGRDYSGRRPYPWMHYAPVVMWGATLVSRLIGFAASFAISSY